eukprot:3539368-Amphidinium_carterae.1
MLSCAHAPAGGAEVSVCFHHLYMFAMFPRDASYCNWASPSALVGFQGLFNSSTEATSKLQDCPLRRELYYHRQEPFGSSSVELSSWHLLEVLLISTGEEEEETTVCLQTISSVVVISEHLACVCAATHLQTVALNIFLAKLKLSHEGQAMWDSLGCVAPQLLELGSASFPA